jgi:hypothetical protein
VGGKDEGVAADPLAEGVHDPEEDLEEEESGCEARREEQERPEESAPAGGIRGQSSLQTPMIRFVPGVPKPLGRALRER